MGGRALTYGVVGLVALVIVAGFLGVARTGGDPTTGPVASLERLRAEKIMFVEELDLYLVYNDGDPLALSADAQHLGDDVVFCRKAHMFWSPFHGEMFDERGFYYAGPARRGLARFPVRLDGDRIHVDANNPSAGPLRGAGPAEEPRGPLCAS